MEEVTKKEIGQRINTLLAERDKKQKELAEALGVLDNTISYFVSGKRVPNLEQIIKIAQFFDVSTDYLLGLNPNSTTDPEVKAICNYTGLSDEAVKALHFLSEGISSRNATTAFYTTDGKYIRAAPSKFVFEFINQEVVRFVRFLYATM